jgi:SAM-dependent methyltransferase
MDWPEFEQTWAQETSHWWFVARKQLALALLNRWVCPGPDSRILDVGCGTGGNLMWLAQLGQVQGLDVSPIAIYFTRRRADWPLAQASALSIPYPDQSFDLVTVFDVLYHRWVSDDSQVVAELWRVLKPGGWLLLTDAALPVLWSRHDERFYARQRYRLTTIRDKLLVAGFEPRVCSYTNFLLLPVVTMIRVLENRSRDRHAVEHGWSPPGWLNGLLIGVRRLETGWVQRQRRLPVGSSIVCLSEKRSE